MNPLLYISTIWLLFEIILGIATRSRKLKSTIKDKFSLPILWIVIILSVSLGVLLTIKAGNISRLSNYAGIIIILAGIAVRWIAIVSLKGLFTSNVAIQNDHTLKTTGIYACIRHPAYCGNLISFLGLGIALGSFVGTLTIIVPITFAFLYRIKVEEAALVENFGESYRIYMNNTKKIVPFIY